MDFGVHSVGNVSFGFEPRRHHHPVGRSLASVEAGASGLSIARPAERVIKYEGHTPRFSEQGRTEAVIAQTGRATPW